LETGKIIGKVILAIPFLGYITGVVVVLPAIILLISLASKKDGIGFPTAAFISFLPSILPITWYRSIHRPDTLHSDNSWLNNNYKNNTREER